MHAKLRSALARVALAAAAFAASAPASAQSADYRARLPEDEIIYLLMPDRFENGDRTNDTGGMTGPASVTGFDPTRKAYYHGGDLKGLIARLDYIRNLGATAIWLTPVFRNKPVQGSGASESAGYHGYWGLDFTRIDPHFGTDADYRALVDAAHARGMKVYFDIVINHTADVIKYRECADKFCPYRSQAEYPYTRRGGTAGAEINGGFTGLDAADQTAANFARLTRPDHAYTPFVPAGEVRAKVPDWLNDLGYYHNRGESSFRGESSSFGDFAGLDDVFTEHPRVVAGMIEIYGRWIDDYGIDGFRIDTARHVNIEFWQAFVPAMLARAAKRGIPNFHIFGEVMEFEPGQLARFTRVDRLPSVNDFALQAALVEAIAKDGATDKVTDVFRGDALYEGGEATARRLVTLTGNHDVLRFARAVREARPKASGGEVLQRVRLANAVILLARGVPALYYGDEQGFVGIGAGVEVKDQDSREDMFATRVASFRDAERLGATGLREDHFDPAHPLYRAFAELARLRTREPALRRGRQVSRVSGPTPGLLAFSRIGADGEEILAAFNTGNSPIDGHVIVEGRSRRWTSLLSACEPASAASASYRVRVPALDFIVCKAGPAGKP